MNIVFIYLKSFSLTGGIEIFNQKFIRALELNTATTSTKVTIISLYDHENDYTSEYKHVSFHGFSGNRLAAFRALLQFSNPESLIFYGHINLVPFANLLYLSKKNQKAHFMIHGIDAWYRFSWYKRFLMNNYTYLAVSNYTKNIFSHENDVPHSNITLFPNCIDIDLNPFAAVNPYHYEQFNLLSVSRLDRKDTYKGIDSVIKTLSMLKNDIPNIHYTIIGTGNDQQRLENLVQTLHLEEHVTFTGFVEEVEPYYAFCDLFILPSDGEGFGIVYLEAMKYKKPVIAAASGGVTDVVLNNTTGLLCSYDDRVCLKEKVLCVYNDKAYAKKLGENGYQHLIHNFTFDMFAERLSLLLQKELT